jgi:hypothetical protein
VFSKVSPPCEALKGEIKRGSTPAGFEEITKRTRRPHIGKTN